MIGELMTLASGLEGLLKKTAGSTESLGKLVNLVNPGKNATGLSEPAAPLVVRRPPPIDALRAGAQEIGRDTVRLEGAGKRRKRLLMKGGKVVLGLAKDLPVVGAYVKPVVGVAEFGINAGRAAKRPNRFEVE